MVSLIIFLAIVLLLDVYCFYGLRRGFERLKKNKKVFRILIIGYGLISFLFIIMIVFLPRWGSEIFNVDRMQAVEWISVYVILFYFPKIFFIPFILVIDIIRLLIFLINRSAQLLQLALNFDRVQTILTRFVIRFGLGLSVIVFLCSAYGTSIGLYDLKVRHVTVSSPRLPESFKGFTLVHISDWHIGTFKRNGEMLNAVTDLINEQNPDAVMFTGDLVNHSADETAGCYGSLSRIEAGYGKYAVFGNHDGEHTIWSSRQEKRKNYERINAFYDSCGFTLLQNKHIPIRKGKDSIAVCGVNYWISDIFKSLRSSTLLDSAYISDLSKAMDGIDQETFAVLLAHDPLQWDAEISGKTAIDLTLSGHTHGGQFALRFGESLWGPASWYYDQWYGLSKKSHQYLYVNPGLGYIGMPSRIGIPPEITVIHLTK